MQPIPVWYYPRNGVKRLYIIDMSRQDIPLIKGHYVMSNRVMSGQTCVNPLGTRRCCDVESTSLTLIQCYDVDSTSQQRRVPSGKILNMFWHVVVHVGCLILKNYM